MSHDFDAVVERAGTDSVKWARYAGHAGAGEVIPLWVADMDFAAPPAVLDALRSRIDHGVFGYNQPTASQVGAVVGYLERKFGWRIEADWIVWLPGLVSGLNVACRAVGAVGDAVFTATPIYPPFLSAPVDSGRRVVSVPLVRDSGGWLWDFAATDAVLGGSRAKLFLLCHPHNPTGRVWNEDELWQIAALAEKHDLVECSDEIHNGLILAPSGRSPEGSPLGGHRLFATLALQKSGHEVLEAVDGIQGLQVARTHKPDLIVCDITMPEMNGHRVLETLRADPKTAALGMSR